jgi:hypothetical protein
MCEDATDRHNDQGGIAAAARRDGSEAAAVDATVAILDEAYARIAKSSLRPYYVASVGGAELDCAALSWL